MLSDRVALVTGSSRGLGRGIALTLARQGATVVVNYMSRADAAAETVRRIATSGGHAWALQRDVTDPVQVATLVDAILDRYGRLDILVNNVGTFLWRDVFEQSDDEWQQVIASNFTSVFYCTRAVLPAMRRQGWDRIVNLGITCVALEEAQYGITVNVVCPGVVPDTGRSLTEARTIHDPAVPVGRPGTWEDIANAVLFFVTDEASFVTGAVLEVNGGWRG